MLLLDEATSALDPRTERLIADTLERVGEGRTTIAVTHRLTSIIGYDRICVIVAGHLAEQGTHDELVRRGGVYAQLWAEQTGGAVPTEAPFDAVGALARIPILASLGPDELASVAGRLRAVDLGAGESMAEGGGRLVIVRRGRAVVLAGTTRTRSSRPPSSAWVTPSGWPRCSVRAPSPRCRRPSPSRCWCSTTR